MNSIFWWLNFSWWINDAMKFFLWGIGPTISAWQRHFSWTKKRVSQDHIWWSSRIIIPRQGCKYNTSKTSLVGGLFQPLWPTKALQNGFIFYKFRGETKKKQHDTNHLYHLSKKKGFQPPGSSKKTSMLSPAAWRAWSDLKCWCPKFTVFFVWFACWWWVCVYFLENETEKLVGLAVFSFCF